MRPGKTSLLFFAAGLFLETASRPGRLVFAQVVSEPASAGASIPAAAPAGGAMEGAQNLGLPVAPALQNPAPIADEFLRSLKFQLGQLSRYDTSDLMLRLRNPGEDKRYPPHLELAAALTISEALAHPETLPTLLPRLERMSMPGQMAAADLVGASMRFLQGPDADAFRNRLIEAMRNIPELRARARGMPESARILDALFDGKLVSLGEAPALAVERPAVNAAPSAAPRPDRPSLRRAAARLRRAMKFGFEPTFTTKEMEERHRAYRRRERDSDQRFSDYAMEKRSLLRKRLRIELGPTEEIDEWSFHDRVGQWTVGTDVGVIELQPPPQRFETILPQMTALFRASQKAGLAPEIAFGGIYGGGGHIHLDVKIFQDNPLLLRNFLVDVHNRPYIQAVLGELGDDQAQSIREKGQELLFSIAIAGMDRESKRAGGRLSWEKTLEYLKPLFVDRFRDVNLNNIVIWNSHKTTVELRMHRAQRAPEDFRDLAEFWLYRLANLSLAQGPIPILGLGETDVIRMILPSVAAHLWKKLVRESGLPRPGRYERFARERFPSPLRLGSSSGPGVELRYAGIEENDEAVYEVSVKDPGIREIWLDGTPVELSKARELPGLPRIGRLVMREGESDVISIEGVPGITSVDLSQARKEIDSYRVLRWRKVR